MYTTEILRPCPCLSKYPIFIQFSLSENHVLSCHVLLLFPSVVGQLFPHQVVHHLEGVLWLGVSHPKTQKNPDTAPWTPTQVTKSISRNSFLRCWVELPYIWMENQRIKGVLNKSFCSILWHRLNGMIFYFVRLCFTNWYHASIELGILKAVLVAWAQHGQRLQLAAE